MVGKNFMELIFFCMEAKYFHGKNEAYGSWWK